MVGKKKGGTEQRERGEKIEKIRYFRSCEKKIYILKNRIVKLK